MIDLLKPYPAMKDSGVEWLGDVPAHWDVRRLRTLADMRTSNVDKHGADGEIPVRLCNYVDAYKNDYISEQMDFMGVTATKAEIEHFRLEKGDVLVTKDSETWEDIGVPALVIESAPDLLSGYHLALLRPNADQLAGGYLFRTLQSKGLAYQFHVQAKGVTRYGLSQTGIKSAWLSVPPLPEQIAIVRFLDHIDCRIRRYIDAKQKLIALLEEQRRAVVHRAVTRGLDPNVRLKPSGMDWLGDVPAHWQVRRLRFAADMMASNVDKHVKDNENSVRLCNYVDVYKNERIIDSLPFMKATANSDEIRRFRLRAGDVLITKDSESWDDIGVPALVERSAEDLLCGYHLTLLRPIEDIVIGAYLLRALQCSAITCQFHIAANGVTRYALSYQAIKSLLLPLPSLDEQAAIVEYLDKAVADITGAIAHARREIALLEEYRTRLIADVVTGKVDVRQARTSGAMDRTSISQRNGAPSTTALGGAVR